MSINDIYTYFITRNKNIKNKVDNKDLTIISNNCWGAEVYNELGIEYKSPFVGMFIFASDYIKLLKNLKKYLAQDLKFVTNSKYINGEVNYPIGILDDVEIHFLHYEENEEVLSKWRRRMKRVFWNNLFIEFSDRDGCTDELITEFDKLKYRKKVCFTKKYYPNINSSVWIKDSAKKRSVPDGKKLFMYCKKYFDIASWLNN